MSLILFLDIVSHQIGVAGGCLSSEKKMNKEVH